MRHGRQSSTVNFLHRVVRGLKRRAVSFLRTQQVKLAQLRTKKPAPLPKMQGPEPLRKGLGLEIIAKY
jgi:hypothetical protein